MAAGDLVTLPALKAWMNLTASGDDALLTRLITSVSTAIQSTINRTIASASYSETRNGTGTRRLMLTNYPVTAVASVTLDGVLLQSYQYVWDQYGIELASGVFTRDTGNVVVSYTAGYASTPADLELACMELVTLRYQRRARMDVASKGQGGESVNYAPDVAIPPSIAAMLQQYKRVVQP